jgi:uncharacterized protein
MNDEKRAVNRSAKDFLAAWWRGDAGPVPCGSCTACCHYTDIAVDEGRDQRRLGRLLTKRSPTGGLVMQSRPDGACIHLGERGCTVYAHRPAACRNFDCRVLAAMGLLESCGPRHPTPNWEFSGA